MSIENASTLENEKNEASNKADTFAIIAALCLVVLSVGFVNGSMIYIPAAIIALIAWGVARYHQGIALTLDGRMQSIFLERLTALTALIEELPGFSATDQYSGLDDSGIAIDAKYGYCALYWVGNNEWQISNLPFSKLLSSELRLDEKSVIKTDRLSQAAGALVGATFAGGVGAIVGGLSAKTVSTKEIKRVSLRLVVDDLTRPIHDITFYTIEDEKAHPTNTIQKSIDQAERWQALLSVAIHRG